MSETVIKCTCGNPHCRQAHIKLEENYLAFYFRDIKEERRVIMYMTEQSIDEFIKELRKFKKQVK